MGNETVKAVSGLSAGARKENGIKERLIFFLHLLYRDENDEEETVGFIHQEDSLKSKELEQLIAEDPEHMSL